MAEDDDGYHSVFVGNIPKLDGEYMSKSKEQYWLQRKDSKGNWITMMDSGGNLYRFLSVEAALDHRKFWHDAPETPDTFRVVIRGTSEVVG